MLDWRTFGRQLIDSRDIDPVYDMLIESDLDPITLKRFIVAYSWFYHVGVAAWIADSTGPSFTRVLEEYTVLPRGSERRHFRGVKGYSCLQWFNEKYVWWRLDCAVDDWFKECGFKQTLRNIQAFPQYGPWMAFKLFDIGVNVLKLPLVLPEADDMAMYSEPVKGARLIAQEEWGDQRGTLPVGKTVRFVMSSLGVGPLEAETVLCKFKAHTTGHYPLGKDTREIKHALDWRPTALSEHLKKAAIFQ